MFLQVLTACFAFVIFILYFCKRTNRRKGIGLDGPKGVPVFGCIFEVNDRNIPFKLTEYAEQFGKIYQMRLLMKRVVVLNSEDILRNAFGGEKYKHSFNDREEMFLAHHARGKQRSATFTVDGTSLYYKTTKKGLLKALHAYGSGLNDLEENVMIEMKSLLDKIHDIQGQKFECTAFLQRSLSNILSLVLTGHTLSDTDLDINIFWEFIRNADFFLNSHVNTIMMTFPFLRFFPGRYRDKYLATKRAVASISQRYFYDIKRTYVPDTVRGIVDHYLEEQRKEVDSEGTVFYTDDQIIADVLDIIHAGITSSLSAVANSILILLNYPEYQRKLQDEFDLVIGRNRLPTFRDRDLCTLFRAFELEVHRLIPVSPLLMPHVCKDHVILDGHDIEAGSTVIGNIYHIHHNQSIWGDPWVFRPERFLDEHGDLLPKEHTLLRNVLAFGYGPRHCLGESFTRTRYFLYIATLLQRMNFEFPDGEFKSCDPRIMGTFVVCPFHCRFLERT